MLLHSTSNFISLLYPFCFVYFEFLNFDLLLQMFQELLGLDCFPDLREAPTTFHLYQSFILLLSSSSISLSSPPSYSDSLFSLASHTFTDKPVSSLSCTLISPLPSSLPPSYPIYRPTPIYTCSRPSSFSVGSIPYLYSSVLSTNTLSLSYHGSSSTRVSSASSGLVPSGPKKRATSSRTRDWLRSLPLPAAPFPYFPPGPTLLVTRITP